jgi:hypothetical protein
MATIQTGRSLTVTIDSVSYSAQIAEATLNPQQTVDQYITLSSSAAIAQPATFQLAVRAYQDWGETGSFCDAMWSAATAGTSISFVLGIPNSGTLSGNLIPSYPTAGGPADGAMEVSFTFEVDGAITKA